MVSGLAGSDAGVEVDGAEVAAGPEDDIAETLPPRRQASPEQPTASEVADHDTTHLNYRAWCPDCVEAFGRERAHHATDTTGRVVPMIAVDYCFLTDRGIVFKDDVDYDWESAPDSVLKLLAGRCSKSGDYLLHAVPKKGLDDKGYAAECLSKSVLAMGHSRCVVRSDNEPALAQLVKAAVGQIRLRGVDVVDEGAVPYDPQSNGQAESAVKQLKGLMRVHQLALERRLESHVPVGHPLMAWLALHVAFLRTTQVIGADGMSAWQRIRGRPFSQRLHLFGEIVKYKCRAQEGGIGGPDGPRFSQGVWLGFDRHTEQNVVFDAELGGIRHSRTLISLPDPQKVDVDKIAAVSATPWSLHERRDDAPVFDKKEVAEKPATAEQVPGVRDVYIKQADLDNFGYSPNCRKCSSIQLYGKGTGTMPHTPGCRARIVSELMKTPAGQLQVERMTERQNRYMAERIAEDTVGAQGADKAAAAEGPPLLLRHPVAHDLPRLGQAETTGNEAHSSVAHQADEHDALSASAMSQGAEVDHVPAETLQGAPAGDMELDVISSSRKAVFGAGGTRSNREGVILPAACGVDRIRATKPPRLTASEAKTPKAAIAGKAWLNSTSELPVKPTDCSIPDRCDWNEKLKTGVDVRDIGRVFEVADREAGRERVERISVLIHAMGGDGKGYRREKAKAARQFVSEIYSAPRVTAMARRLPKYGLEAGLALDMTVDDDTGLPFNFKDPKQRAKADKLLDERRPFLLIGSPPCTPFSQIQAIHRARREPQDIERELIAGRVHLEFCCYLYRKQIVRGADFLHEHPQGATSWREPCIQSVLQLSGVRRARGDQCQFGQVSEAGNPVRKATGFMSNADCLLNVLSRRCFGRHGFCSRDKGGRHQ